MTHRKGSGNDRSTGNLGVSTTRENARETEEGETDRAAGDSERVGGTGHNVQGAGKGAEQTAGTTPIDDSRMGMKVAKMHVEGATGCERRQSCDGLRATEG